jgi:hypothetical protein
LRIAYDLAAVVDAGAEGGARQSGRIVEIRKNAVAVEESVIASAIGLETHYLAGIIDAERACAEDIVRIVQGGKYTAIIDKSVYAGPV